MRVTNAIGCPRLECVVFLSNAFANYEGKRANLSFSSLPSLTTVRFGKESFWNCQTLEMRNVPSLKAVFVDADALHKLKRFRCSHMDASLVSAIAAKRMYTPSITKL